MSEEAVNDIVKQVDANGDGQISFEEFAHMMKKLGN
jgi:Ca2+-binding EF-hand superfamily protein